MVPFGRGAERAPPGRVGRRRAGRCGIVARYWARETIPQIIHTVALIWLFLLVMDLIRFRRWRHGDAASGSAGRVR